MAEIGLVASVIQVAGFGAAVAKNLYNAADVMIHANQQILALAKHVSQFTAVLKRMGEVLDAEKANCSKKVLRDIRSIKHSCEKTFKEIKATVKSKHFRHFIPVKWIFKRTKAMELESRLDSHQSMLQCIITTLTVSKLGHIETRSKEDSQHISGLKDEITLLKTFIMESYNNLTELRRNESRAEMETKYQPNYYDDGDGSAATSSPQSDDDQEAENVFSSSDDEPRPPDEDQETSMGVHQNASPHTDKRRDNRVEILPSTRNDPEGGNIHRESNLLLQMVPYRPNFPGPIQSDRLLPAVLGRDGSKTSTSKGPTESVRHLLDKWTLSGSAPISTILDEESSKEEEEEPRREEGIGYPRSRARRYARPSSPRFGEFGDHFGASLYPENYNYPPYGGDGFEIASPPLPDSHMRYGHPHSGPLGSCHKDFWRSNHRFASSYSHIGDEILHALRSSRGGIHYAKANHFRQVHYIDARPIYTCNLVPSYLIPQNESMPLSIEIGDGLVRKEALDLLGYSFSKTKHGDFLIQGNLDLREIEELVKLSYQALDRKLTQQSRKIIKERGLKEAMDSINLSMPQMYPPRSAPSRYSPPPPQSPPRSPPSPPFQPTPVDPGRSEDTRLDMARREVRFTLPGAHMTSSAPNTTEKTKAPTQNNPPIEKINDELRSLHEKHKKLLAKSDEAEKARDLEAATDLKYYAIPYIERQIKEKEEEWYYSERVAFGTRAAPAASDARTTEGEDTKPLQTEVETESEDSDIASGSA